MIKPVILLASDHAGVNLKSKIIDYLKELSLDTIDFGTNDDTRVECSDYAHAVCNFIKTKTGWIPVYKGILICGSGIDMSIAANRHHHIRCALVINEEMARLARQQNDANVLALGARMIKEDDIVPIIDTFLMTNFEGGDDMIKRLNKIK